MPSALIHAKYSVIGRQACQGGQNILFPAMKALNKHILRSRATAVSSLPTQLIRPFDAHTIGTVAEFFLVITNTLNKNILRSRSIGV